MYLNCQRIHQNKIVQLYCNGALNPEMSYNENEFVLWLILKQALLRFPLLLRLPTKRFSLITKLFKREIICF